MTSAHIPDFDTSSEAAARAHQLELTKPAGSLGRLEQLAAWYAGAHGTFPPPKPDKLLVAVFAADHGVAEEGVSAYPASVTAAMVANMLAGGAAITVMARRLGADVAVVDVGVAAPVEAASFESSITLHRNKVRAGTRNFRREAAMTRDEVLAALRIGDQLATRARHDGYPLLVAGEVGIANTTCAAALICALTGSAPEDVVGIGTGISEVQRARKIEVVRDALRLHAAKLTDPIDMMASIGGLELTAMTGFFLAAARERLPVIVDGYLATAAALVAKRIAPRVIDYMRASHASAERGAAIASSALGITPLLDFGLRLGEGTGALLAADLVRTAVELQLSMATFASASVPRRMSLK